MRHAMTPHGSKIDALKLMAQGEKVLPAKFFKSGKLIKQLGEPGAYGSASLYSGTYQGKKYAYVKKVFHKAGPGTILGEEALANMAEREAQTMIALRDVPGVPKIYGYTTSKNQSVFARAKSAILGRPAENAIFMEYVPGKTLDQFMYGGGKVSKGAQASLVETIRAVTSKGIEHVDLHAGNILVTKKGATIIDWGLTEKFATPAKMEQMMAEARMQSRIDEALLPGRRSSTKSRHSSPSSRAEKLKIDQRQLSEAATYGGKGHTHFTSSASRKR
jgi:serine/threonine protein kinase